MAPKDWMKSLQQAVAPAQAEQPTLEEEPPLLEPDQKKAGTKKKNAEPKTCVDGRIPLRFHGDDVPINKSYSVLNFSSAVVHNLPSDRQGRHWARFQRSLQDPGKRAARSAKCP